MAYDLKGNGLTVVRAGAGYFFGRVPYVLGGNVQGSENPIYNLTCTGSADTGDSNAPPSVTGFKDWSASGSDNPVNCAGTGGFSGVPTYTIWSNNFNYPETLKANVGFETLFGKARLSTDLIYSRSTNLYTVRNLNLRPVQFTIASEGNRQVFTPEGLFSPGAANTDGSRLYNTLGDVFMNTNDGRAEAYIGTVEGDYKLGTSSSVRLSYTYTHSYDNSSYSCCTASSGFSNPIVGQRGPNDIGTFGDTNGSWGPSQFAREHTIILSGFTKIPLGIQVAANLRIQSGRPFTPETSGDINGDGVTFNDRPFIYAAADLPVASAATADATRQSYADVLAANSCISKYVGQIIPKNTCRTPWVNSLDMRLTKEISTLRGQHAELQIDLFNVLNGLGQLGCNKDDYNAAVKAGTDLPGTCGWGRVTTVSGANQDLFNSVGSYNSATGQITYGPNKTFGRETVVGSNLNLQFQTQIALKYYF
jgi:hypothetical protein